jgi:hypothetical protein
MFGRIFKHSLSKGNKAKTLNKLSAMSFRSTPAVGAKLGIGDAADILQQKISGISQIVSRYVVSLYVERP